MLDDEIATAGSIVELLRVLRLAGAGKASVVCTHGLFTGQAIERLRAEPDITQIVTTDTVPQTNGAGAAQPRRPLGRPPVRRDGAPDPPRRVGQQPVQRRRDVRLVRCPRAPGGGEGARPSRRRGPGRYSARVRGDQAEAGATPARSRHCVGHPPGGGPSQTPPPWAPDHGSLKPRRNHP